MSEQLSRYEQALDAFRARLLLARVPEGHRLPLMTAFREVYELGIEIGGEGALKTANGMAKAMNILTQHIDDLERGA